MMVSESLQRLADLPRVNGSKQIAVLIEFDDTWGRNVVEAIAKFAHDADWQLLLAPRDQERRFRVPPGWKGDGVIASVRDPSLKDHLQAVGLPTVDVANMYPKENWLGRVATNDCTRAAMAFDHFRTRQLQHFAIYSPAMSRYPSGRSEEFRRTVEAAGYKCSTFQSAHEDESIVDREEVAAWLSTLPRPVGIFASDPYPARQLAEICVRFGFDIPGGMAILSGDEDELLCGVLSPRISSIELASHRIGYDAARMLHQIMTTGQVPSTISLLDPLRVCARRSTDLLAIDDPQLRNVVQLIWDRAADGVQVTDLVRAVPMSRRKLEQRFREVLGRTPAEEIRRVKLERARQMIVTTTTSVAAIALSCGFSSGPYLTHAFRKQFGITPSDLRVGREPGAEVGMSELVSAN
ncbi:substrate-binding domain-containing protein [Aeoliella sp. SH292]|uniref:AraC family transcriptional regulator n=1 Tax=Aeoliella sp. SH292 TaxID=3454464 RepID=UPI003F95AC90